MGERGEVRNSIDRSLVSYNKYVFRPLPNKMRLMRGRGEVTLEARYLKESRNLSGRLLLVLTIQRL